MTIYDVAGKFGARTSDVGEQPRLGRLVRDEFHPVGLASQRGRLEGLHLRISSSAIRAGPRRAAGSWA